jgi:hypothetical protein
MAKAAALVAVVAFFGAVVGLNVGAWSAWREDRFLESMGNEVAASVIDESSSSTPRSAEQYWLTVRFEVEGRTVEGRRSVDANTHLLGTIEDAVIVVHDPADPTRFDIAGNERGGTVRTLAVIVDLALAVGLVVLVRNAGGGVQADPP